MSDINSSDHPIVSVPEAAALSMNRMSKDFDPNFELPSPIVTRRMRRDSLHERASKSDVKTGEILFFCRQKGHGFIQPKDGTDKIFVHVSDIDGEYVPHHGDIVDYKECLVPPKMDKKQATHVVIRNLNPGVKHELWSQPPTSTS